MRNNLYYLGLITEIGALVMLLFGGSLLFICTLMICGTIYWSFDALIDQLNSKSKKQ